MKSYIKQLLILLTLSALASCAATSNGTDEDGVADRPRRSDCIHEPSIRGYRVLDEQNLIVEASGRRSYHVVLMRRAFGLRSSWGIVFDSPGSRVCEKFSEIIFEDHFDGDSIRISKIYELTPEEEEDLLIRFGKKEPEIKQTPAPADVEGADVEELDTGDGD